MTAINSLLVGLVGFEVLFLANRRARNSQAVRRLGGFGGFRGVISSQSACKKFPGSESLWWVWWVLRGYSQPIGVQEVQPHCPDAVGVVWVGGGYSANRRARCEAAELLGNLRDEGFRLHLDSAGGLVVQPASALTDEHRRAIRAHRTDLVALLEHEAISNFGDDRRRCTECRHLRADHRCAEAMQGRMPGVDRHMTPLRHLLQRCPNFKPLEQISGTPDVSP